MHAEWVLMEIELRLVKRSKKIIQIVLAFLKAFQSRLISHRILQVEQYIRSYTALDYQIYLNLKKIKCSLLGVTIYPIQWWLMNLISKSQILKGIKAVLKCRFVTKVIYVEILWLKSWKIQYWLQIFISLKKMPSFQKNSASRLNLTIIVIRMRRKKVENWLWYNIIPTS